MKSFCFAGLLMLLAGNAYPQSLSGFELCKIHHLVIVWLKQAGDQAVRQQYIAESQALAELPGVVYYRLGEPAAIQRQRHNSAVDETYDVAVDGCFESRQALEEFLKNPQYLKLAQEVLRPLVDKYLVYEFVE